MLELLVKYAREHGLVAEPGFTGKDIRWAIVFDDEGRFLDVVEMGDPDLKRNPGRRFEKCPDLSQPEMVRGGVKRSHFLAETADVVALYGKSADTPKTQAKHEFFITLLREAGMVIPELAGIAAVLSDDSSLEAIRERLNDAKARETDKVTFRIADAFPLESNAWHDWWRDFRKSSAVKGEGDENLMRCFATGELVEPAKTHPKIRGLANVGGNTQGDALIGFDKESFRSYGLEQSANAAVSEDAASAYRAALNHLVENYSQRLAGAKVVHWYKKKVAKEDDPLAWLEEGQGQQELNAQEQAKRMLDSIRTRQKIDLQENYFYALTLSGASGRVMVRDWMEGRFENLVENIAGWFDDISITNLSGLGLARAPGIERIITCTLPSRKPNQQYGDWIRPIGAERAGLWIAAIMNQIIPQSALSRVVLLNRNFLISGVLEEILTGKEQRDSAIMLSLLYTRMGLIRAYHSRKERLTGGIAMAEVLRPELNEGHPNPAYQCGRLMAILASLQRSALGNVGAGVVQRYYAAASATPSLVLGRLTRTSQFHLNKLEQLEPGLAHWYEERLSDIWSKLGGGIPRSLNLEGQSLFALGYYQQIADMRKKKIEIADSEKEVNNG